MKERGYLYLFTYASAFIIRFPKCLSKLNILIDITIIKQAKKKPSKKINIGNLEMLEGFTNLWN